MAKYPKLTIFLIWVLYTVIDSIVVYHDFYNNFLNTIVTGVFHTLLAVIASFPVPFLVRKYPAYNTNYFRIVGVYGSYLTAATLFKVYGYHFFMKALIPAPYFDQVMSLNYFRFYYSFWLFLIIVLLYSVRAYLKQYKEKEIEAANLRRLTQEMQLSTLKSQLNPHFLFNALNSISSLASQSAELTRSSIQKLSHLLRILLKNSESEFYPLEEELEFIKSYLELEYLRFQDKLKYTINVESSISRESEIPILLLQPLIENSIKHGLKNKLSDAEIRITISKENNYLKFSIADNGTGFAVNPLEDERNHGIGLKNLKNRLHILYGDSAKLSLKNCEPVGCLIDIEIPEKTL